MAFTIQQVFAGIPDPMPSDTELLVDLTLTVVQEDGRVGYSHGVARYILAQRIHGAGLGDAASATAEFIRGAFAREFSVWGVRRRELLGSGCSGHSPQRLRSCGLQVPGDSAEQIGFGAGSGEGDAHTRGRLRDASGDLEQPCA